MAVHEISRARFDALCYVRDPSLMFLFNMAELAWFEAFDKKILAIVVKDYEDSHTYLILGRDRRRLFRCIDTSLVMFETLDEARASLMKELEVYSNDGNEIYPQGDEKELPNEIFVHQAKEPSLNNYFKILADNMAYEPARGLVKEAAYAFNDVDGNYIKDFQTTGFDSRLWELYLYLYFVNSGFSINREFKAPDFLVSYLQSEVAVEAVTVNSNPDFDESKSPVDPVAIHLLNKDYIPIKFGSPLTSKLKKLHKGKRYWELDHVVGKSLVFAIHDYHLKASEDSFGSMTWSREGLEQYLYGVRMKSEINDGKVKLDLKRTDSGVEPTYEDIVSHNWKGKSIPSNFFKLPDSENISAILFTNNATLGTFNRMGKLAGFGSKGIVIKRMGVRYDPNPNATDAIHFMSDIDDPTYEESWADTLMMYHNPYAKFPLDPNVFGDISHVFYYPEEKSFSYFTKPFDVLSSVTYTEIKV
jgi:hypothetical protein